jgi:hypothetical protein
MAMPMPPEARRPLVGLACGLGRAAVAWPRQGLLELGLDHAFDELPDLIAYP